MKTYVKNLLSMLVLASFLLLGLVEGNGTAEAYSDPYYGWVCPDDQYSNPGQCDPNQNATTCTWGPSGCENGAPKPGGST